ncbi:hypothetical protein N866_14565, partial [Actinotalea ferrariae CF5-4]
MTTLLGVDLRDRRVLVVGGGTVAARRLPGLVAAGAHVVVVAAHPADDVRVLAAAGQVTLLERPVLEADLEGAWLVHACTGDAAVDAAVAGWSEERRTFCVVASAVGLGSARVPATATVDDVVLGVVSAGAPDPRRVAGLRDGLAALVRTGA